MLGATLYQVDKVSFKTMTNLKHDTRKWWMKLPFEGLMVEIFGNKMFVIDSAVGQTNHSDKNAVIFFHGFPW